MLTRILATGFKGLDFDQPLGERNLIVGPNGSGKSARSQCALLALLGHVPGVGRRNQDILEAFGTDGKLCAGVEVGGKTLERRFSSNATGAVKQEYRINGRKADKDSFARALMETDPRILDLPVFLALSDQKKIDEIFKLFPPSGDVEKLETDIEDLADDINAKNRKVTEAEASISRLRRERSGLELPAGTQADIQGEIAKTEEQLSEARAGLESTKIEAAKEAAAAEATEKERVRAEAEAKTMPPPPPAAPEQHDTRGVPPSIPPYGVQNIIPDEPLAPLHDAEDSIRAIMAAMENAGCGACAAMLVAKREIKKFQQKKAA